MKKLLALFFIALSYHSFAQKSDTLIIPVGKYQFIKVGDKVYKLVTTLEEAKPKPIVDTIQSPMWLFPSTKPTPGTLLEPPAEAPLYLFKNTNQ